VGRISTWLTESEIFKNQVLSGPESTDNPSQEMSERRDYGQKQYQNLIETRRIKSVSKSFILRVHEVLTRDKCSRNKYSRCLRRFQPLLFESRIGVSRWYAGRIREGYRPHPRRWRGSWVFRRTQRPPDCVRYCIRDNEATCSSLTIPLSRPSLPHREVPQLFRHSYQFS